MNLFDKVFEVDVELSIELVKEKRKKEFDAAVKQDLKSDSSAIFINNILHKYDLADCFQWSHIYNQAYLRAMVILDQGKEIPNPIGWMRITEYNIVREASRKKTRSDSIEYIDDFHQRSDVESKDFEHEKRHKIYKTRLIELTKKVFSELTDLEKKILLLHSAEKLSFAQIRNQLIHDGYGEYTEAALRKRKSRTVKRIKDKFYEDFEKIRSTAMDCQ